MTLTEEANRAEQVGNALSGFRGPNPDHIQDINAAVAESNLLGSALREIERLLEEVDVQLELIEDDLQLVHKGITITLRDVWAIIGNMGNNRFELIEYDYRQTWKEIENYCHHRGGPNLKACLGHYRLFVNALCKTIQKQHLSQHEYADLRYKVKQLDGSFPKAPLAELGRIADNPRKLKLIKPQSFERHRGEPLSPLSPTDSDGSHRFPDHFFPGPSPPLSPPTTVSSLSEAFSNDGEQTEHWAKAVFETMTATEIPLNNELSRYHGPNHPTHDPPSSRYIQALAMTFPPGLRVSLHYRPSKDSRAKIAVKVPMSQKQSVTVCLPLSILAIMRSGCMLRLCRPTEDGTYIKWVSLQFSHIEMLILFANTFVAMRAAGGNTAVVDDILWRDEFHDETLTFEAVYFDNGTKRILSIYRDKPSQSTRIQASIKGGQLHGCPLWTAWITHYVTSPTWCETLDRRTIILRDLRVHVFASKYSPQRAGNGTYIFNFESSSATREFISKIDDLRRKALRIR